jgi:hypothetical protein
MTEQAIKSRCESLDKDAVDFEQLRRENLDKDVLA